jgi:hypothetical protein
MPPGLLVKLLHCCTEVGLPHFPSASNADKPQFIKLLKWKDQSNTEGDLCLRLMFCEFLAACTYTTLARAEDNTQQSVGHASLLKWLY